MTESKTETVLKSKDKSQTSEVASTGVSRRGLLFGAATVGAAAATGVVTKAARADDYASDAGDLAYDGRRRADIAFIKRIVNGKKQFKETLWLDDQLDNDDEQRYDDFIASFYKTLPQNDFGEVNRRAYRRLRRACRRGDPELFDRIPLSTQADRRLANPQGAFRFEAWGLDSHATRMPPAPTFRGAVTAAEMGEVYWQAITRDVPFNQYGSDALVGAALNDLNNNFSATVGPKDGGSVTAGTLFRGETPGDLIGPYISQFLWLDVPWGPSTIVQRYNKPVAGVDYMITPAEWIDIQRGANPANPLQFDPVPRYIFNNRSLGEYVHVDVLFQAYFNAALIMLSYGPDALDPSNPYLGNPSQGGFTSFGGPYILDLVTRAGNLSLSGAWFHKWRVHRRLRPEAYGGRVHFNSTGDRNYELSDDIMNSDAISRVFSDNGTGFLPMAFAEGSPTHPAYPAGHATIAGACTTILKAVFNEDFILPTPVVSNDDGTALDPYSGSLRAGDEFNKLANNVSIGRDAAGVHYRTDGVDGLVVGEQQALALLRESTALVNEDFNGFTLTLFDGSRVRIVNGDIYDA
ncbi:MAG: vanadium-dependent haloperoxidase [Myxococcota bacterium]